MVIDYQSPARAFVDIHPDAELASETLARDIARFNRSAALRSEQARLHRTLLYAFLVVLTAAFIGAITPQAMENWHNVRAENVQP